MVSFIRVLLLIFLFFSVISIAIAQEFEAVNVFKELQGNNDVISHEVSPNGELLVVLALNIETNKLQKYLSSTRDIELQPICFEFEETDGLEVTYGFSKNSEKIVCSYSIDNVGSAMYVVDTETLDQQILQAQDTFSQPQWRFSEDSAKVFYTLKVNGNEVLFSINTDASGIRQITPATLQNHSLISFQESPDGSYVVHRTGAGTNANTPIEIYSYDWERRLTVKLNNGLETGRSVSEFQISPNSERVAYIADENVQGAFALFSVPIDGANIRVRLNTALVGGGDVKSFLFLPDSSMLIYRADELVNGVDELFLVPASGGERVKVSVDNVLGTGSFEEQLSSDGEYLYYGSDAEIRLRFRVYAYRLSDGISFVASNSAEIRQTITQGKKIGEAWFLEDSNSELELRRYDFIKFAGVPVGDEFTQPKFIQDYVLAGGPLETSSEQIFYTSQIIGEAQTLTRLNLATNEPEDISHLVEPYVEITNLEFREQQQQLFFLVVQDDGQTLLYIYREKTASIVDEICFPILAMNGKLATVCL